MINFMSITNPLGRSPYYPLDTRMGEPQIRYGCYGEERNLSACQKLNTNSLVVQPIA
jgi:hypothetical protein